MLCFLLVAAPAAHAGTIEFAQVLRADGGVRHSRPANEVRLRVFAQDGAAAQQNPSTQSNTSSTQQNAQDAAQQPQQGTAPVSTGSTLSQSGGQVETIDIGDVTGTVCDCGEIPSALRLPVGGFPWWTLAGIPLVCVSGVCADGDDEETPPVISNPTPTPTTPTNPVPEPVSLILFGSGLLAVGARARRRGRRLPEATLTATTEEV